MKTLKLEEFREAAKLSQREVARMLDIAHSYYWKWEKGKSFPNAKQIMKLCDIFNCTPNDLFGIKGVHAVKISELKNES